MGSFRQSKWGNFVSPNDVIWVDEITSFGFTKRREALESMCKMGPAAGAYAAVVATCLNDSAQGSSTQIQATLNTDVPKYRILGDVI